MTEERELKKHFPGIKKWDRIEPAVHLHPDVVHGDRCRDYPACKRRILVYRRAENLLLFCNRLIPTPGVCKGIPHLQLSSFLFDSMHVLELGVLANLFGKAAWGLIHQGCFGPFTSTSDADHIDENMTQSVKACYKRAGHGGGNESMQDKV